MAGRLDFMNAGNGVGGRDIDRRRPVNHAQSHYWDCVNVGAQAEASTILKLPHQVMMTTRAPRRA